MHSYTPNLEAILDQTLEVVWLVDPASRKVHYINHAFERVWGRPASALLGAACCYTFLRSTMHPDDRDRCGAQLEAHAHDGAEYEYRVLRPNGEVRWVRSRGRPYADNSARGWVVGISEDITERKRHEDQFEAHRVELEVAYAKLQEAVITDPLTGLKNRRGLNAGLERLESDARRHGTPVSAIAVDIDHFKLYNDAYGHPAGDTVLVAISMLILRTLRPTDLAARVGGEEFVVLLPDTDRVGAVAAAERIRRAVAHARWPHRPVTASFGVSTAPPDQATSTHALLPDADQALYQSKRDGRNRVTHHADMPEAALTR